MKYGYIYYIFIIVLIVISVFIYFSNKKRNGFQNNNDNQTDTNKWSPDLIKRFNEYQTTMNNNITQFNLLELQRQAIPEEVEEYLSTGAWPWTDELKNLYLEKVWSSSIIKIDPQYALNYAMSIYNQQAARELLAWNTKEGEFLLYGGDLGVFGEEGTLPTDKHNTIKCSSNSVGDSVMQKTLYNGMNLWNGTMNSTVTNLDPKDIPNEMPGFSFVNRPCNPCVVFNSSSPDYSCPFKLNVNGDDSISEPWKQLWNL